MVFTDGDDIWRWRSDLRDTTLEDTTIPPRQKGLIRTALKGYLEGAGNLLEFKGRYMRMKTATNKCIITTEQNKNNIVPCDVSRAIEKDKE